MQPPLPRQLKNKLYDPYVKSLRWASDKIGPEGIIALITNNSFLDAEMFDGMRQCLAEEFDILQILDLGGNIRKGQPGDSNVFGIQVGVSINFLVKTGQPREGKARILYTDEAAALPKERTFQFLTDCAHVGNVTWREITPNARQMWLTEGLRDDFETFIPMGTKAAKATKGEAEGTIFKTYSLGIVTSRDAWVYHFKEAALQENMTRMIEFYNAEVGRWEGRTDLQLSVNDFVNTDRRKIKWTDRLKAELKKGKQVTFSPEKIRASLYRPFTKSHLYFDRLMNQRVYVMPSIFPTSETEQENRVICVSGIASNKPFQTLIVDKIPCIDLLEKTQCFPFLYLR